MKSEIPAPVFAVAIVVAVAVLGFFLYRGATGGVQGDGRTHNVEASPPIGGAAKQGLNTIYKH
jgi:hypothetical protein